MKTNTIVGVICSLLLFFVTPTYAQVSDVQLYGFIHSLVVHDPPLIPVPNTETTVPYWVNEIAQEATNTFAFTGQFGQLPNHVDNLPPVDNLGVPGGASPWDSSTGQTFANSSINTTLLTVANFIQWVPPSDPDPSDPMGRSIISNTQTLFDWVDNEKPSMRYYIYGNWPEMDNASAFPPTIPTQTEITDFHNTTMGVSGSFNNWWIQYQDAMVASRPSLNPRLIPVGRIISEIYTQILPNTISFDLLYEDSAPHGRANTYFLAGLITYMALYEQQVPSTFMPSTIIHPDIRNNLSTINNYIWTELNNFNFSNGDSRVFYSTTLPVELTKFDAKPVGEAVQIEWAAATEENNLGYELQKSNNGSDWEVLAFLSGKGNTSDLTEYKVQDTSPFAGTNYYRLKQIDFDSQFEYSPIVSVNFNPNDAEFGAFYPNPSSSGITSLELSAKADSELTISVMDVTGKLVSEQSNQISKGDNRLNFDFSRLSPGVYVVVLADQSNRTYRKLIID